MHKRSRSVVNAYNKRYVETMGEIEKSFLRILYVRYSLNFEKKLGANENKSLLLSLDEPANSNLGPL